MTEELIRQLIAAGLTKQQARSVLAEKITNLYMNDDGKILIAEAKRQVDEMKTQVENLKRDYYELKHSMEQVSTAILGIQEAQNEFGAITDDKAKNVVALYAALISMNQKAGASSSESVTNAGYVMYAYLGGQARRDVSYAKEPKNESNTTTIRL